MLQALCGRELARCGGRSCSCGAFFHSFSLRRHQSVLPLSALSTMPSHRPSTIIRVRLQLIQSSSSYIHTSPCHSEEKRRRGWHLSMSEEEKKRKLENIEKLKAEEAPTGLFAKVKYYLKRYWYIAIPAHCLSSILWFGGLYAAVASGVDVVSLLEMLHIPDVLIEKIKNTPPSAGFFVVALILYKIATPARYATTLAFIQAIFWGMRRLGKLKTAHEVEYRVRSEYEQVRKLSRRYYRSTQLPNVKRSSHAATQRRNSIPGSKKE